MSARSSRTTTTAETPATDAPLRAEVWRSPVRLVRPLAVVLAVLVVLGPVVRIAVDGVAGDPDLPQAWLTEAARLVDLFLHTFSLLQHLGIASPL